METTGRSSLAIGADALTALRLVTAVALIPLVWVEMWAAAGAVLALAWITDVADGRLARVSPSQTALGRWDMRADTAVGAGLVLGLIGQGTIPVWAGVLALALFGGLFLAGNLAASMLLQLTGFLPLLWILWSEKPALWWLPFLTAVAIGIADWRRLVMVNIPAFIRGISGRFEHR